MKKLLSVCLASGLSIISFAAQANHHLMAIREIYAGSPSNPNSQYVLLQMRGNGQNVLGGHSVVVYSASGAPVGTYTFNTSVASGATQSFVYIATSEAQSEFGIAADLTMTPTLSRAGGRVCFNNIDCVAWGSYSGSSILPCTTAAPTACQTGTPFKVSEGLASGRAARRNIAAGDPNLLEAGDDTGSSSADFQYTATPRPINNAGSTATAPVIGSGIALNSFSDVSELRMVGGAVSSGGVLRLTPAEGAPITAGLWHLLRQPVSGGLDTRFVFRITQAGASGADGLSFVIQNESNSSLGSGGAGLGYAGITNSLAVEFDTNYDPAAADPYEGTPGSSSDPAENHISVHSQGANANSVSESASLAISAALPALTDGSTHTGRVVYVAGTLQVYVDNLDVPVARASVDLANLLQLFNGSAFVGFTGATAVNPEDHDLLSWQLGGASVDTTPSAFAFSDQSGIEPNGVVVSQPISVGGINSPTSIGVSGGEYQITSLGGAPAAFTSAAGMVSGGDTVVLRHTAATGFLASNSTTLTIGGVSDTFTSTTRANGDTSPNAFSFTNQVGVVAGSIRTSNAKNIAGINVPVPATVRGDSSALLLVNGVAVSSGTMVSAGDQLKLRIKAGPNGNDVVGATLTVGSYTAPTWTVTSVVDDSPNAISFTNQTGVVAGRTRTSNAKTITGINVPVAAIVSGDRSALLLVNGVVVSSGTMVSAGDQLKLRLKAGPNGNDVVGATLTVGTYTAPTWTVTTQ